MVRLRLEPADEYMHEVEEASTFNESMYFNVYDSDGGVGGFFRLGNRPNEGYAEMTTCVYLPDGRVAFMFDRPKISGNEAFDAGGMRFGVDEPFERLRVDYEGKVIMLTDPSVLADPRKAFTESPWDECTVSLDYRAVSPMYGGEPEHSDGPDGFGSGFARGHYEQHVGARGSIRVGDAEWAIDGYGLRDHSWGPRTWQAPWWYRWLTANFGEDGGFVVSIIAGRDGNRIQGGMVLEDGEYRDFTAAQIQTTWEGPEQYHQKIAVKASTADRTYEIEGEVLTLVPLRNRRKGPDGEEMLTRISEGMTRWTLDGATGYGLSEYLDQIVDGAPVGAAEESS